jgi:hypothetical protein
MPSAPQCSAAKDEELGEMVAIKKITNAFEHHTFAKRTLREITLMRMMNHENVSAAPHRTTAPADVARTRSLRVLLLTVIVADY